MANGAPEPEDFRPVIDDPDHDPRLTAAIGAPVPDIYGIDELQQMQNICHNCATLGRGVWNGPTVPLNFGTCESCQGVGPVINSNRYDWPDW